VLLTKGGKLFLVSSDKTDIKEHNINQLFAKKQHKYLQFNTKKSKRYLFRRKFDLYKLLETTNLEIVDTGYGWSSGYHVG